MLEWAAAMNGKVRKSRKATMIAWILANITELERIKTMRWSSREWAMTALREVDKNFIELPRLLAPPMQEFDKMGRPIKPPPISRLRSVCKVLGLHPNKINGRTVITRQQLTLTSKQVMLSDLPVDRRGESSPEFGLEIDINAKPTQLCPSLN